MQSTAPSWGKTLIRTLAISGVAAFLFGCATQLLPYNLAVPAQTIRTVGTADPMDGRRRFREIFCSLLVRENGYETGPLGCEKQLHRLIDEAPLADSAAPLPAHDTRYEHGDQNLYNRDAADVSNRLMILHSRKSSGPDSRKSGAVYPTL